MESYTLSFRFRPSLGASMVVHRSGQSWPSAREAALDLLSQYPARTDTLKREVPTVNIQYSQRANQQERKDAMLLSLVSIDSLTGSIHIDKLIYLLAFVAVFCYENNKTCFHGFGTSSENSPRRPTALPSRQCKPKTIPPYRNSHRPFKVLRYWYQDSQGS